MVCKLFEDDRQARCTGVIGFTVPTLHERERYCRSGDEQTCPTYRLVQLRGGPVPEEAYYALWLPPAPIEPDVAAETSADSREIESDRPDRSDWLDWASVAL